MHLNLSNNQSVKQSPLIGKTLITEMNRQSLMSMMKQIMEKSFLYSDELHCVLEESNECSESMLAYGESEKIQQEEEMKEVQKRKDFEKRVMTEVDRSSYESSKQTKALENYRVNSLPTKSNISHSVSSVTKSPSISKTHEDHSLTSSTNEFDKLIEITSRCVEYYNNFIKEKSLQFDIIEKTFTDINSNIDLAFEQIISQAQRKQKQLKQFLSKKYKDILQLRNQQDNGLKTTLEDIRSVHLTNLMKNGKQSNKHTENSQNSFLQQQISKTSTNSPKDFNNHQDSSSQNHSQLSFELHNYASTLNQFYVQMQEIQKSNFKQMVEQSVSFINNLICEEIKVLMTEKIPSKLSEKRMMRQKSKDFLSEESENQAQTKGQNFGMLDMQSFTKLFLESSKLNADDEKIGGNKAIQQIFALIQSRKKDQKIDEKSNSQEKNKIYLSQIQLKECNKQQKSQQRSSAENKLTSKRSANLKNYYAAGQGQQNLSLDKDKKKSIQKSNFIKKQIHYEEISPSSKKCQNEDLHKQNSLQLIKKISNQQNNRSAKIKGYMVSFQDSAKKQIMSDNFINKKEQKNRLLNNSKSPQNKSKTPTKLNKSGQKRTTILSNVTHNSNQTRLKSSQQVSLKSSRNSGYVSQFKIASSRRQSVVLK